jgi:hypothetical protein
LLLKILFRNEKSEEAKSYHIKTYKEAKEALEKLKDIFSDKFGPENAALLSPVSRKNKSYIFLNKLSNLEVSFNMFQIIRLI